jgi:hypothetical protein
MYQSTLSESISHKSIGLGVHLSRHPADPDVLESSDLTARDLVELHEMRLPYRGDTI